MSGERRGLLEEPVTVSPVRQRVASSMAAAGGPDDLSEPGSSCSTSSTAPIPSRTYGTLNGPPLASGKRSVLVPDAQYPRTHFTRRQFLIAAIAIVLLLAAVAVTLVLGLPRLEAKRQEYFAAKFFSSDIPELVHDQYAVLVTGHRHPACANAGRDLLARNGTAMDAALASLFCLLMASPHLVDMGTGFRGLVHRSAEAGPPEAFEALPQWLAGSANASVAYPILAFAAQALHQRHGRAPWTTVLTPAIWLAANGIPVSSQLARLLHDNSDQLSGKGRLAGLAPLFRRPSNTTAGKRILTEAEPYRNPALAETLRSMARVGPSAALFDNHQLLDDLAAVLPQLRDQAEHMPAAVIISAPFRASLSNGTLWSGPDDSHTITMAHIIKVLERLTSTDWCQDQQQQQQPDGGTSLKQAVTELHYLLRTMQLVLARNAETSPLEETFIETLAEHIARQTDFVVNETERPEVDHKPQANHNVLIMVHDRRAGHTVLLTTAQRHSLFDRRAPRKLISAGTGLWLDMADGPAGPASPPGSNWPVLFTSGRSRRVAVAMAGGRGPVPGLLAGAQVLSQLLIQRQQLKPAVDRSRLFFDPDTGQTLYEGNFPKAYIDLLARLYQHYELRPTGHQWLEPAVHAMAADAESVRSMVDYRHQGAVSGGPYI